MWRGKIYGTSLLKNVGGCQKFIYIDKFTNEKANPSCCIQRNLYIALEVL